MKDFRICSYCDFEWNLKDGPHCPVCNPREDKNSYLQVGGVFGTGKNFPRWKSWIKAIALVTLVYFVYQLIS
jgi:hypothetical protein